MATSGNRNPMLEEFDVETLLNLGPVQPKGCLFRTTAALVSGRMKALKFQEAWYEGRPWLEYSVDNDSACCYYCRMFRPKVNG